MKKKSAQEELVRARRREREAQAQLAELKLDLEQGKYVEPAAIREYDAWLTGLLRNEAGRLVDEIVGFAGLFEREIANRIRLAARAMLTRMAETARARKT